MILDIIEWAIGLGFVALFISLLLAFPIHPVPTSPKCRCPNCKPMRDDFTQWERELAQARDRS